MYLTLSLSSHYVTFQKEQECIPSPKKTLFSSHIFSLMDNTKEESEMQMNVAKI